MKLVARKFYIDVDVDRWLDDTFGPQREKSRAVDLALRDFIRKVENRRGELESARLTIDLDRIDTRDVHERSPSVAGSGG